MQLTWRRLLVLVPVVGGLAFWGLTAFRETDSQRLVRIQKQLAEGDHATALPALRKYLDEHPDDVKANFLAGSLLARTEPDQARTFLERVPPDSEDRPQAVRLLAAIALERNDPQSAKALLEQLQTLAPDDPAVSLALAECHLLMGDYEPALGHAREAAERNPARAHTHFLIAEILDHLGRVAESVEPLKQAIAADPEWFPAHANLAYALHFTGENRAALAELEWCLEREPDNVDLLRIQAEIVRDEGDLPRAKSIVQRALRGRPQDVRCNVLLGEILLFDNQPREALAVLEPLFARHRDNRHLTTLLSRAAWLAGDTEKAQQYQKLLMEQLPQRRTEP